MIVVVCPNPALDITYRVDRLVPGAVHRAGTADVRAGGKGTNVARVLCQLGRPVTLVTPLGGLAGAQFAELLAADYLCAVEVQAPTRSSVAVVDGHGATVINEHGPVLQGDDWLRFADTVCTTVAPRDVVVLSGSLPGGAPVDAYGRLISALPHATCILDTSGGHLVAALPSHPAVAAPNLDEVRDATGRHELTASDAAVLLHQAGAEVAVVSDGPAGLTAAVGDELWQVAPPRLVDGNPTGAGDALTAALAAGEHDGTAWPQRLCDAVMMAGAAVAAPVAGELDEAVMHELRGLLRPDSIHRGSTRRAGAGRAR